MTVITLLVSQLIVLGSISALGLLDLLYLVPFLYFGPETYVPLASFIASVVGILLVFWKYVVSRVRKAFRALTRKIFPKRRDLPKTKTPVS